MAKRRRRETVTTERVALVAWLLCNNRGVKFTTADLARRVDLGHAATWAMLDKMSRAVPIVQDIDGWWIP